ncbi:hypothetical protein BLI708_09845 [Bifidobacterium imperatoris]|uniref:Uncharacterized protein n=1 Tax=Bifidobacterium imperatoris TaxID=2020965 RepID=A0A2N5IS03_9BIFI|nr:hypothetical protein [Bifidobacterium imperatoris]PLS24727.1 hypothetical protein Tam1G_1315 [Bifidobacterium imperatoris]QSY57507.1 hypothetical protein BLI708_09845 [Bifidobacterium imperatoris]
MRIYSIGPSEDDVEEVILDSNLVNPLVIAVSGKKPIQSLFPDRLIWTLSNDCSLPVNWQFGACEEYRQRAHEDKEQVISYCNSLFPYIKTLSYQRLLEFLNDTARSIPSLSISKTADMYNKIYATHLSSYFALLHLFSLQKKISWNDFYHWILSNRFYLDSETLRFSKAFLSDRLGFAFNRLTHDSGSHTGDMIAKSAWNVSWDLTMLNVTSIRHGSVLLTQDAALLDYWRYSRNVYIKPLEVSSTNTDIQSLLINEENRLNVTNHFNASLAYAGGLRTLL